MSDRGWDRRNRTTHIGVGVDMSTRMRPPAALLTLALLTLAIALSACGAAGPASSLSVDEAPSPTPASTPPPSPTPTGIAHPTGADEIVLRYDEAGGFVPVEWMSAHVPYFTLYGDGRVVFVSTTAIVEPTPDGVVTSMPVRTAVLSEEQVQDLLVFALRDGGLAVARADYQNPMVADAPSTVFEIHADGDTKTVSIMALGMDADPGPDTAIKSAFRKLAELLRDFDKGGSLGSAPYRPTAYRGVLNDATGAQGVRVREWPWVDIAPTDFMLPADPNVFQVRTRSLGPDEAKAIGVGGFEGGISGGVYLRGPDGALYSLTLRPLLPDENA